MNVDPTERMTGAGKGLTAVTAAAISGIRFRSDGLSTPTLFAACQPVHRIHLAANGSGGSATATGMDKRQVAPWQVATMAVPVRCERQII